MSIRTIISPDVIPDFSAPREDASTHQKKRVEYHQRAKAAQKVEERRAAVPPIEEARATWGINVAFKLLRPDARMPTQGTPGASGYDLYLPEAINLILPGFHKIPLGISIALPPGFEARILPRSSTAFKYGMIVLTGTVDSDYRGEIAAGVFVPTDYLGNGPDRHMQAGDRICQLVIASTMGGKVNWIQVQNMPATERGEGGFGSTGR
jgi:dUTP pyrophosphatase